MRNTKRFHIHGDNIVECERTLSIIISGLDEGTYSVEGPTGSPTCPIFTLHTRNPSGIFQFTFFPGFGRWNADILGLVSSRGGVLREAADAIVTSVDDGKELPLLVIEYCGALPAGNQAWQRNGRAYSFGLAHIPYLYVAEIGGYELDSDRSRKAPRLPNSAVPFSYLSFSHYEQTMTTPIFTTSPGADEASKKKFSEVFGDNELIAIVQALLFQRDTRTITAALERRASSFVTIRATDARAGTTLRATQWNAALKTIQSGQSLLTYLLQQPRMPWSKTAYIKGLTPSFKKLMTTSAKYAWGLTSTDLPMCIIPSKDRVNFAREVLRLYPKSPTKFSEWLARKAPLSICWVMGFKPAGDDARPNRGLPPLTRMLIGPTADLLTIVYGPAPASTWSTLNATPRALAEGNGLWEAILESSNALLIDSKTDRVTEHGFLQDHWGERTQPEDASIILVEPTPTRIGENDIDTVLHLLLSRLADAHIFEGMCNPPGGDWSGISLLSLDRRNEFRWLSLPRVSGAHARPNDQITSFSYSMARPRRSFSQ